MLENINEMPKYMVQIVMLWVKKIEHSFSEISHQPFLRNSIEPKYLQKIITKGKP